MRRGGPIQLSLRARLSLLVVVVLVVSQVVTFFFLTEERRRAFVAERIELAARDALALADVMDSTAPEGRMDFLASTKTRLSELTIASAPISMTEAGRSPLDLSEELAIEREFRLGLSRPSKKAGSPGEEEAKHPGKHSLAVSAKLSDGRWLNANSRLRPPPPPKYAWPVLSSIAVAALALVGTVSVAAAWIARPTVAIAAAAERLGTGDRPEPLRVSGPPELRRIAIAFNLMAERITKLLDERAQILAAIGHDLKSPITAMRLRIEAIDDAQLHDRLAASIDEIEALTVSALALAHGAATNEPRSDVDIAALLGDLVRDFTETGADVTLSAPSESVVTAVRRGTLMRALRNIIDNAVLYGERARVAVRREAGDIIIEVDDDGPSIPEAVHDSMFQPFVRLERSRNRDTGGAGLGLSIARAAIEAQNGSIAIDAAPGGGTRIVVRLNAGGDIA